MKENTQDTLQAFAVDSGSVKTFHKPLTPAVVLRKLPYNATPEQQDSAIQANFQPKIIAPSNRPDTLNIPGLEADPITVDLSSYSYKNGYFSNDPMFHPELRVTQIGFAGDPLPYRLHSDDYVTGTLLLSFFLMVTVITRSFHMLSQQVKDFFYTRERENLFSISTDSELRGQLFLIFQTCFILGILFFDYTQENQPDVFNQISPYYLLGLNVGICIAFYTLKVLIYAFVNWIFFDKKKNEQWMEAYFLAILALGVTLFPVALLVVYFEMPYSSLKITFLIIIVLIKILLFYKCYRIFFSYYYGYLHLFVYFCTLEILPSLVLWRALVYANKYLVVNF